MSSTGHAFMTAATPPLSEPRCSGICVPCAISLPLPSKSATEQSRRSLMLVENDERTSVLFMSSVMESSRLLNTSIAIGSNSCCAREFMFHFRDQLGRLHRDIAGLSSAQVWSHHAYVIFSNWLFRGVGWTLDTAPGLVQDVTVHSQHYRIGSRTRFNTLNKRSIVRRETGTGQPIIKVPCHRPHTIVRTTSDSLPRTPRANLCARMGPSRRCRRLASCRCDFLQPSS